MDRNGVLALLLLFFIVSNCADAIRRLDEAPKINNSTAQQVSPLTSTGSSGVKPHPKPQDGIKSEEKDKNKVEDHMVLVPDNSSVAGSHVPENSTAFDSRVSANASVNDSQVPNNASVVDSPVPTSSSVVDPKGLNNDTSSVTQPSTVKGTDDQKKSDQRTDEDVNKPPSPQEVHETCDGLPNRCTDAGSLEVCILNFGSGSKELVFLVQNKGKKTLKVSYAIPISVDSPSKELEIPKHQAEKINISLNVSKSNKIIFNAGSGECELLVGPAVSKENLFLRLPSFDNLVAPVNSAYFLILTGVFLGATWACCKCRKSKRHDGIPYQELEMGLPESVSATNVETAEGWDQGWDDDWDEDHAVKSPVGRTSGSISANGLTARSPAKDGWDNNWDD